MSPTRYVNMPAPFPHQREILMNPCRFKTADLGRQAGKTLVGGMAALYGHGPISSSGVPLYRGALFDGVIQWTSKDFPNTNKIWKELNQYLSVWGGDLDVSKQEKCITFPGGGQIFIRSGHDPDSLRGPTITGAVNDELAFWHEDSLETLRPALGVHEGWEMNLSTPDGFNWFFDEWRKGAEWRIPNHASWHWASSINPAFTREEFERLRASTNPNVFAREYLAEFSVTDGSIFRRDWFKGFTQDEAWLYPEIGEKVAKSSLQTFMTADFALTKKTYSDHTAIAVVSVAPDKRIFIRDLLRVKVTRAELVPMCLRLQERWEAAFLYCESSGELANLNQEMRQAGIRIRERKIHQKIDGKKGEDKVTRAYEASKAVELSRVFFLHNKQQNGSSAQAKWVGDLIAECCAFTGEDGRPDDMVDALSLSVLGVAFLVFREGPIPGPRRKSVSDEEGESGWLIGR